ncbi:hypothetical protein [Desulfosporosinus sp.]|uniref:hypothetical protein n=1 Tax=Desulfosporosinus sp. TaxID=157907 RepID=UPI0025BFEE87|nr:hypothetical protein [Desulfosporosinus sp.]MBC2721345.1 hypothetical protein [Desulfosporosinus sp.]MBC2728801.1 hypothetical protein [Desulfosporosinus sp.]
MERREPRTTGLKTGVSGAVCVFDAKALIQWGRTVLIFARFAGYLAKEPSLPSPRFLAFDNGGGSFCFKLMNRAPFLPE